MSALESDAVLKFLSSFVISPRAMFSVQHRSCSVSLKIYAFYVVYLNSYRTGSKHWGGLGASYGQYCLMPEKHLSTASVSRGLPGE